MSTWVRFLAVLMMGVALTGGNVLAAGQLDLSTAPQTNNGKKWRIGYYEGGNHQNYYDYLLATIQGLMALGWIKATEIAEHSDKDTRVLWNWIAQQAKSDYLEFDKDAYYSVGWDNGTRAKVRSALINRLNKKRDIHLMIAMGSWAGKDLASNEHSTPTIIMSTSDPIKLGIIRSIEDSGYDHVHARVDPRRYEQQVGVFHDIIGFKKLGVAYENSIYGRTYAAIDLVEKVAKEQGFEIVRCFTQSDIADQVVANQSIIDCFQQLANTADAIYVTQQGGVNPTTIPVLVKIAHENRIPTFSQLGADEVKYGFLLSLARPDFKSVGQFFAATIAKVMNGAKPRELIQLFEETPNIAINLKTAEFIGLYLYADVLAAADEIYWQIEMP